MKAGTKDMATHEDIIHPSAATDRRHDRRKGVALLARRQTKVAATALNRDWIASIKGLLLNIGHNLSPRPTHCQSYTSQRSLTAAKHPLQCILPTTNLSLR